MKAIILSAGQGRRLMPLTENTPKCCLKVGRKALLEWQIESLAACGINEVVVVTGFGHHLVENLVGAAPGRVRALYNPFYALSDNLGTCWVARAEMRGEFVLINGDTLFEPAVLARLLASPTDAPITLATDSKTRYDEDDMKIVASAGRLERVGKKLDPDRVTGESIGMMRFDAEGAECFVDKIEHLMAGPEGLARWYLSAIDDLARSGRVGVCSISGLGWCEVDDLADLAVAEVTVAGWAEPTEDREAPWLADSCPAPV